MITAQDVDAPLATQSLESSLPPERTGTGDSASPDQSMADSVELTQQDVVAMVLASAVQLTNQLPRPNRVLCSELVELTWTGLTGCQEHAVANMEEIWRTGATLDTEQALPEAGEVGLRLGSEELQARVLYCQQTLAGYRVGLQFLGSNQWNPERFVPAHAVELGSLGPEPAVPPPDDEEEPGATRFGATSAVGALMDRPASQSLVGPRMRSFSLESLAPLIARGSLAALGQQMRVKPST